MHESFGDSSDTDTSSTIGQHFDNNVKKIEMHFTVKSETNRCSDTISTSCAINRDPHCETYRQNHKYNNYVLNFSFSSIKF